MPLVFRGADDRELRFFSTVATFGTAVDITVAELAIESFFPADAATGEALREPPRRSGTSVVPRRSLRTLSDVRGAGALRT